MHHAQASTSEPPTGEIHVWRVPLGDGGGRAEARAMAGRILGRYLGEEAPALEADANGKPRLAEEPGRLAFNLSHSGGLALLAVAAGGFEVGVDVERLKPRRALGRLAARWLPGEDAAAVGAAAEAEREAVFYTAWTRLEARIKCTGSGFAGPRPGPEVVARELPIDVGYRAAVAFEPGDGGEPRIEMLRPLSAAASPPE